MWSVSTDESPPAILQLGFKLRMKLDEARDMAIQHVACWFAAAQLAEPNTDHETLLKAFLTDLVETCGSDPDDPIPYRPTEPPTAPG